MTNLRVVALCVASAALTACVAEPFDPELDERASELSAWQPFAAPRTYARVELFREAGGTLTFAAITRAGGLEVARQSTLGGWGMPLALGGVALQELSVAQNLDGRVEIFVLGGDGAVYHQWQTVPNSDLWSGWAYRGGTGLHDLSATRNQDGRLEVFALGSNSVAYRMNQTAPSGGWTGWSAIPGVALRRLEAAQHRNGRLALFGIDTGGGVQVASQVLPNGGWGPWSSLGGWGLLELRVAQNLDGRLELFALGSDRMLYQQWQTAPDAGFGGWYLLGGTAVQNLATARAANGALNVFPLGGDRLVYRTAQNGPGAGFIWHEALGGPGLDRIEAGLGAGGRMDVMGLDAAGHVFHTSQTTANGPFEPAPANVVVADAFDPGRTQWLVGNELAPLLWWCLPDMRVRYSGDPAKPSELLLFARDPNTAADQLAALSDADIKSGAWTAQASAPAGTPRVIDLPYPAHGPTSTAPTIQTLSTPLFWGSSTLPPSSSSVCVRPPAPQTTQHLGAIRAAATVRRGACSTPIDLEDEILQKVAQQTYNQLNSASGTSNTLTIYSHLAAILRRDAADPTTLLGGFAFAFHYSFDFAGVGNEVWGTWEFLLGLNARGELTATRKTQHRMGNSGVWGWIAEDKMETGLYNIHQNVEAEARARQEIADSHYSFITCSQDVDCGLAGDLVASAITAPALASVGLANATNDDVLHARCAVGHASACTAIGAPVDVAARWRCGADNQCRFRLPAKRLNPGPDVFEMVWFDGPERDNPAFAFAAAGGASQMCTAPPVVLVPPAQHYTRFFVRSDAGP